MKIKIPTTELKTAIQTVIPAVATSSQTTYMKAYEFIHIKAESDLVTFSGCNLSMQIKHTVATEIEECGEILVAGKLFSDIVNKLDGYDTIISSNGDKISLKNGNSNLTLATIPAIEYQGLAVDTVNTTFEINEKVLKDAITTVIPFALADGSRPILKSVAFTLLDGIVDIVAMNHCTFAKQSVSTDAQGTAQVVISSPFCAAIVKALKGTDKSVLVSIGNKTMSITADNTVITVMRLEGDYIAYNSLIPQGYGTRAIVETKAFTQLLDRAYLLANSTEKCLANIIFSEDSVTVCVDNEVGSMDESIPTRGSSANTTMCFDLQKLRKVIKAVNDEEIALEVTAPNRPCVVKPVEGNAYVLPVLPVVIK